MTRPSLNVLMSDKVVSRFPTFFSVFVTFCQEAIFLTLESLMLCDCVIIPYYYRTWVRCSPHSKSRRNYLWTVRVREFDPFMVQLQICMYYSDITHCPKMEMNEEKLSKFQIHFPVLLVPCTMKKKLSKKSFVFGLPR